MITKNEIINTIKQNTVVLKKFNVDKIGIFGSYVKGNPTKKSDIDILVHFSDTISLVQYVHLTDSLSGLMHQKVDLVTMDGIKPLVRDQILGEVEWIEEL